MKTMTKGRFQVRVYSDCEVRKPASYFHYTFGDYRSRWKLLQSDHPNCILCESVDEYDEDQDLQQIYDRITPEMYTSTNCRFVRS